MNQVLSLKQALIFATLASIVATLGDFLLLYVVNAGMANLNCLPQV